MIVCPQNKAMNVPATRNGPKGTSDFIFFFFKRINPIPIIAPEKKATNKATKISIQPRKSPIKKASLMSPIPMPLPRVSRTIAKKNPAAPRALKIKL